MHNINNFIRTPLQKLRKLNRGDKIELFTFKKDRKIVIIKKQLDVYDIVEDGFEYKEFYAVKHDELERILKQLKRIEFPRSKTFSLKVTPAPDVHKQLELFKD